MNASLLDVFHDCPNHRVLTVANTIDIHFHGVFEKAIDKYRAHRRLHLRCGDQPSRLLPLRQASRRLYSHEAAMPSSSTLRSQPPKTGSQ